MMAEYIATVESAGEVRRIGPYRLERRIYTDSDGTRHGGWLIWSGNFGIGTGHRGSLAVTFLRHWQHLRRNRGES
jgi:hypothetical protein